MGPLTVHDKAIERLLRIHKAPEAFPVARVECQPPTITPIVYLGTIDKELKRQEACIGCSFLQLRTVSYSRTIALGVYCENTHDAVSSRHRSPY